MKLSELLRQAINEAGITRYRLSKLSGIDQATLSRFVHGSDVTISTADGIAQALGLTLVRQDGHEAASNSGQAQPGTTTTKRRTRAAASKGRA